MKRVAVASAITAALAGSVVAGGSASAATPVYGTSCSNRHGAYGEAWFKWSGKTHLEDVRLTVEDTAADGHHVGIRLGAIKPDGNIYYWGLHEEFGGKGASHTWTTSATLSAGIRTVFVSVNTTEGSKNLWTCVSLPGADNPSY